MKIECLIQRQGGSHVTLGSETYHFAPNEKTGSAHVADVEIEEHVARLLSITDGYRQFTAKGAAPKPPATTNGLSVVHDDPPPPQGEEDGEHDGAGDDAGDDEAEMAAAKADYVEKFGKKPHHTWSAEVIRSKIAESND